MSGFDRIRAPGDEAVPAGSRARQAMFSHDRSERLAFVCADCGTATPVSVASAAAVLAGVPVILAWRTRPVHGRCPACSTRTWLAVRRAVV